MKEKKLACGAIVRIRSPYVLEFVPDTIGDLVATDENGETHFCSKVHFVYIDSGLEEAWRFIGEEMGWLEKE